MKNILFPVDFTARCDAMSPAVAALARLFNAKLTLLHVLNGGPFGSDFLEMERHFQLIRDTVRARLTSYQAETFAGLTPDRVFKVGDPVEEIVLFAERTAVDLIIMPTQGRTRFRELLLGSVTAGVLHDTGAAVLTSAHAEAIAETASAPGSILCAIDMSPVSVDVLAIAAHFAGHHRVPLDVIHVLAPATVGLFGTSVHMEAEAVEVERVHANYALLAAAAEMQAPLHVLRSASAVEAILNAAAERNSGLLVIGRGKMQGVLGRLRSGAHELIRRSRCPVLSF